MIMFIGIHFCFVQTPFPVVIKVTSDNEMDSLDAYMSAIKAGAMDTKTRLFLKRELLALRKEEQRLSNLVNIAKPVDMPLFKKYANVGSFLL